MNDRSSRARILVASASLVCAWPVEARQGESAPATPPAAVPPAPVAEDEDQEARQLERRSRDAPVVTPTTGRPAPAPGAGHSLLRPSPGALVREGAFLRERRGRLVAGPEGQWVYVFDADELGKAEPPMLMQPSRLLEEMRHIVESRRETTTFITTGQVFVYQGRNHFLPTYFSAVADVVPTPDAAPAGAAQGEPGEADALLRSMGAGQDRVARRTRPPGGPGARAETGDAPRLLREGLTLTSRRGRVHRGLTGEIIFTTDNSPGSRGGEPPMSLLPCLNLEAIEKLVRAHGERASISLSGTVMVYSERNYLLPTMYRVEPDMDGNVIAAP